MEENKKKIEMQMLAIYEKYQIPEGNPVIHISYYNEIIIKSEESRAMLGLQDVFPVGVEETRNMQRNRIVLYQAGIEMAEIDENSNIEFSQEYMLKMKETNFEIYILIQQVNGTHFELPNIEIKDKTFPEIKKQQVENFTLEKEELEEKCKNMQQKNTQEHKKKTEQPENEEENITQIAQKSGLTEDDIKSCAEIDPQEKITDSESFENIAGINGKYVKILVIASSSQSRDGSKFAFWGITSDGCVEQVPGLEERQGVNTGKSIYAINRDGTEVKEQQTSALFTMPNQREGFSVTIGQYGIVETTYIRKSPEENKFIGSPVNSTTQKPTTREVQEFMNDSRTNDSELQETISKAEHQLSESEKTHIRNIDANSNNDVALNIDAKIEMHDGTITTLREESEKLNISPEEYAKLFEQTKGDCASEKIESIRIDRSEQKTKEEKDDEEFDRGERLTPEEMALKRNGML